jgi:hypothetical protein
VRVASLLPDLQRLIAALVQDHGYAYAEGGDEVKQTGVSGRGERNGWRAFPAGREWGAFAVSATSLKCCTPDYLRT